MNQLKRNAVTYLLVELNQLQNRAEVNHKRSDAMNWTQEETRDEDCRKKPFSRERPFSSQRE